MEEEKLCERWGVGREEGGQTKKKKRRREREKDRVKRKGSSLAGVSRSSVCRAPVLKPNSDAIIENRPHTPPCCDDACPPPPFNPQVQKVIMRCSSIGKKAHGRRKKGVTRTFKRMHL